MLHSCICTYINIHIITYVTRIKKNTIPIGEQGDMGDVEGRKRNKKEERINDIILF